jgi:hypothetical protein
MNTKEAILSLLPDLKHEVDFELIDKSDGSGYQMHWFNDSVSQPSQSDITAEIKRLQDAFDVLDYSRKRKSEYDALNQFELISDDAINSTTTHADAITAIKTKWPKNNKGPIG